MADRIRGITVEINGDTTGLSKALSGVNSQIKTTQSQLKDVEKLLKLDPTNTELLRQKQVLLSKAIEETTAKVDTLKEAERQMAEDPSVDKNGEKYMALKREIIEAENALNDYKEAQNGASGGTQGATSSLKLFSAEMVTATGKAVALAAGVVALGKKLASFATDTAAKADDILTQSSITGLSTTTLQELEYASPFLDVDTSTITSAMARNIRSMSSASSGTGDASTAYAKLGISVTNASGELRNSETIFWEVVEALKNVENETERDAISMAIFGKSAQDLNPLIEAGSERFKELARAAHEAGYVMDQETLSSMGEVQDKMDSLKLSWEGLKQSLGIESSGIVGAGLDKIKEKVDAVKDLKWYEKIYDFLTWGTYTGVKQNIQESWGNTFGDTTTVVNVSFEGDMAALGSALEPYVTTETTRKGSSTAQ